MRNGRSVAPDAHPHEGKQPKKVILRLISGASFCFFVVAF
jgi:hypothetical protein